MAAGFEKKMLAYHWPGNIRQLRNIVEWAMIMKGADQKDDFGIDDLPPEITRQGGAGDSEGSMRAGGSYVVMPLREAREVFEREYLQAQISRFGGNISKTAQFIGMERSALHRKLKSLNIINGSERDEEAAADNISPIKQQRA